RLEHAIELQTALGKQLHQIADLRHRLSRALQNAGQEDRAIAQLEAMLTDPVILASGSNLVIACEDYGALMRIRGRHDDALRIIEAVHQKMSLRKDGHAPNLMVETARLHAHAGRWDQAEALVRQYLTLPAVDTPTSPYYRSSAHLLLGCIV